MIAFLDTSVLTRRYLPEKGSDTVRALFKSSRTVAVSRLTFAELSAAIARAHRLDLIEEAERNSILDRLPADFAKMSIVEPRRALIESVSTLVRTHALRGYDALQLASCLRVRDEGAVELWAADGDLVAAARAERIKVVAL